MVSSWFYFLGVLIFHLNAFERLYSESKLELEFNLNEIYQLITSLSVVLPQFILKKKQIWWSLALGVKKERYNHGKNFCAIQFQLKFAFRIWLKYFSVIEYR